MVATPDPAIVGDRWRDMWMARLETTRPRFSRPGCRISAYDAFWQHGSIATDYSAIQCPMYVVDGQIDSTAISCRARSHIVGPAQRAVGPLGSPLSGDRGSRSRARLGDRGSALVDAMAQGYRYRDHGGAAISGVHGRRRRRSEVWPQATFRAAGSPIRLALAGIAPARDVPQCTRARDGGRVRPRDAYRLQIAGDARTDQARMVSMEHAHRSPAGSDP